MKTSIVATIFARGGSKGVPRKNIRLLNGKPLIAYAIEAARGAPSIGRVVVSTDDAEIASVAKQFGAEVPFMRPNELARDDSPEWLAWRHAIETLESQNGSYKVDILVSVPATAPLRTTDDIEACVQKLITTDADIVITVTPASRNPYFNMVTLNASHEAQLVIPLKGEFHRRQDAPPVYDMTTVAYAARANFVKNHNTLFGGKVKAVIIPPERALDIDTELDFQIAEVLMNLSPINKRYDDFNSSKPTT